MPDVLLVELARRAEHARVCGARVVSPLNTACDDDGYEVRLQLCGQHIQTELRGHVARLLLIRHDGHVARGGAADDADEAARLFRDEVGARTLVPRKTAGHQSRGPHQFQTGPETHRQVERERGVNVEQQEDARLVERREDYLPDCEGGVRIGYDSRLWAHVNYCGRVGGVEFERVAFEAEGDFKPVEHLQRVDPRFERAVFIAEDG